MQDALQQLSRWDMQEPFSEETLASAVGLGPVQLRRLFEKVTGHSPFQHYDQRRMHLATHSLKESQLPMKELAFDLGFSSPAHFSNWFRSRRGIPPGAYRKRTNNE